MSSRKVQFEKETTRSTDTEAGPQNFSRMDDSPPPPPFLYLTATLAAAIIVLQNVSLADGSKTQQGVKANEPLQSDKQARSCAFCNTGFFTLRLDDRLIDGQLACLRQPRVTCNTRKQSGAKEVPRPIVGLALILYSSSRG